MSKPRVPQNLPPESQQWVRDIERRLNDLETQNQRLTRSVTQNAGQLASIAEGVRFAVSGAEVKSGIHVASGSVGTQFGQFFVVFTRPAWANKAAFLLSSDVSLDEMNESVGEWGAGLYTEAYTAVGASRTLVISDITRISMFAVGSSYETESATNSGQISELDPSVDSVSFAGNWGHEDKSPTGTITYRVSVLCLWYATKE